MARRIYVALSTREYAELYGVSERTARRRLAADRTNAVKTGRGYKVAVPATDYAKRTGKSATSVRRRGFAVESGSPTDALKDAVKGTISPRQSTRERVFERWVNALDAHGKANNPPRVMQHIQRAPIGQVRALDSRIPSANDAEYSDMQWLEDLLAEMLDDEWTNHADDDTDSILFYR